MKKIILVLLAASALTSHAALTLVKREPFVGPGTLTGASPGSNFSSVTGTLTLVRVGPRTSSIATPGWSADVRTTGAANSRGTINLSGSASLCGMWGAWVRVKTLPTSGNTLSVLQLLNRSSSNVVMDFVINSNGIISTSPYNNNSTAPTFTSPSITPNTWVWLAVAWQIQPGSGYPYSIRCMSMPLGGSLTTWGSANNLALDSSFSAVNVGLETGGTGPMARIGCPSLYSMTGFSDIAYPSDVIAPVEQANNWYVNTRTGNDSNDGSTPATAWLTAAKITTESQYCGMLDTNTPGPGNGDVLTIDTSSASLVLGANPLTFTTEGLKVQPVSGQTYIKCQAEEFLTNSAFTATAGLAKTYQTADTQANIVAWENDEWMWHVKSASFSAAASVTNPQTGATTNYTSTGAALDAVPGSFYTDGANLYIHPFGDTNPKTDGKVYTRSINRTQQSAVVFSAGNYRAIGFYIRKTTLVDQNDSDFGAYCFQDGVLSGTQLSNSIEGGYFAYGDKHCFGSTGGATNSTLLVLNTECEQGHPYCGFGGQTPFVSYSGATTADNVHTYRGCICLTRSGLIGSTAGDPVGTGGDVILSHNNGSGTSFASITLDGCNFANGAATIGVASSLIITNQTQVGQVNTSCPNTTVQQTTFRGDLVAMRTGSSNLSVQNCLIKPAFNMNVTAWYGFLLAGTASIEGCTFDLTDVSGDSGTYFQGTLQRTGPLVLTFRNNVYLVPSSENLPVLYGAAGTDTLIFDHNAYNLGGGTTLLRAYSTGTTSLTFTQWQNLGQDCTNSSLNANLVLQNDIPQTNSPLFNMGLDLGTGPDFTGTVYTHRNTIGAYEGSSTYLPPQTIAGFSPLPTLSFNGTPISLPATTNAGLAITYMLVSGPAQLVGHTLTLTGTGTVVLTATQAGNASNAPLSESENIAVVSALAADTPTMPVWGLALMAGLLALTAVRSLRPA